MQRETVNIPDQMNSLLSPLSQLMHLWMPTVVGEKAESANNNETHCKWRQL